MKLIFLMMASAIFISCQSQPQPVKKIAIATNENNVPVIYRKPGQKIIHVFVALCDNKYQGIVPVPKAIGNGQEPANNLYWGCSYGIKTYFKNSSQWQLVKSISNQQHPVLERCIFKHKNSNTYLIADAYDGKYIKNCTQYFLKSCAGLSKDSVILATGEKIYTDSNADLLAYIGHNGLMDFTISEKYNCTDTLKRESIILACISRNYFKEHLKQAKAKPLLWSTGLMAPEAYTLHDAIESWIKQQPDSMIRENAAKAYSKYQHCSEKAAKNLLVSGW
ncbi:hypothetical protein BH10BAC2_BH10BAC2_20690 [soil metagenome]